ncbi:MAG TPA: glycosyltransferase family 39 protein [Candidatus Limnocylindrales bacterium]|nr:glycosyltransferase family 39 protein [Candidatus Limnocylindrales bacterium]
MSRREALLSAGGVFLVALAVRAWAASLIVFPKPEDTAYYVAVARNLLDGRGLVSDAIWSFGTPPLSFPRPAFEVWLPLPTWLAAIPMAVLGPTFRSAQLMAVVVGALVAVLAWRLAADVAADRGLPIGRARTLALGTGLTAAVFLPLILHSTLPDSTAPFAALVLGACLLMTRLLRDPTSTALMIGLGLLLGLAALTRNEAIWLALTWAVIAWANPGVRRPERLRSIAVPAVVAALVFAPWAVRDWLTFGSPLPGQAAANALSLEGSDIFAWSDPPTLARYLAAGPARLLELRLIGIGHDLFDVLLFLGVPVSIVGLLALPWLGRPAALRPLLVYSILAFATTSLLFPVSTTWGTFLHAAGAIHVLLIVSALLALDAGIARVGRRRGWTRPVAWLGPAFAVAASLLFVAVLLPTFGTGSEDSARRYEALPTALAAAGARVTPETVVLADNPIWVADSLGARAIAVPDEPIASVLSLARRFDARLMVLSGDVVDAWPDVLESGDPQSDCFRQVALEPADPATATALEGLSAWRIECP